MSGDSFGSPPWGPAEPVPELEDTQALPGLGPVPGKAEPGHSQNGQGHGSDNGLGHSDAFGSTGTDSGTGAAPTGSGLNGHGPGHDTGHGQTGTAGPGSEAKPEQDPPDTGRRGKQGKEDGDGKHRRSFWRELPILIVVALVLALIIKAFAFQAFWIPSGSMQNTLEVNDRVLVNKLVFHLRPIHRGDVIVFDGTGSWNPDTPQGGTNIFSKSVDELEGLVGISHDDSIYIKRVIGLPGDHVVCCDANGQVTVNGVALSESDYLFPGNKPSAKRFTETVPAGDLWVMGDHRKISDDSRGHTGDPGGGAIPESGVIGRAFVIIWPPSRWGFLNIPATFEQPQLNASSAAAGGSSAALASAMGNGTPIQRTASPLPLALGFAVAVPITWLQRRLRTRGRKPRGPKR